MRKEASLEQWKELYEAGQEIKDLKPWEYLWDMDLISIKLPEMKETCYCSVLGRNGDCYGIITYIGYDGLRDFYSIAECGENGMPAKYVMYEQSNLSCYFGNREEVQKEQKQVIKDLCLKFRGKNQWIYFESYKKGYVPYILDEKETLLLTKCLKQFILTIRAFREQKLNVNFEKGETLLHRYDNKKKNWVNENVKLPFYENEYPILVLQDEILKNKIKKQPKINAVLELDMAYMNSIITDKKYDRPVNPKLMLMMDHSNDMVIGQHMLTPENNEIDIIINMFINFVMKYGRPKQILIRNPLIFSLLVDICEYCSVSIAKRKLLRSVDSFLNEYRKLGY
ncbi:MAG: hypothetical protein LIR50_15245 [Bacillota bacterium]|nr:hypothetical protein [Bacillota bacterium]